MIAWGFVVFIGLCLVLWDLKPITRARLMGNPLLIHVLVIGSGLVIHGGSSDGAMAAIVSGVFSAIYVRIARRLYGYIKANQWYPGALRLNDPRAT